MLQFFFFFRCKCNRILVFLFMFFVVGGSWQFLGWAGLVFVMAVIIIIFFNLVFLYIYFSDR